MSAPAAPTNPVELALTRVPDDLFWIVAAPAQVRPSGRPEMPRRTETIEHAYPSLASAAYAAVFAVKDADPNDLSVSAEIVEVRDGRRFSWGSVPPHPCRDQFDIIDTAREIARRIQRATDAMIDSQRRAVERAERERERRSKGPMPQVDR